MERATLDLIDRALDEDEGVREAFAQELHRILWYFYATCRMTPPDADSGEAVEEDLTLREGNGEEGPLLDRPPLSVDFFTPLLGSLLLNANNVVSEAARQSVGVWRMRNRSGSRNRRRQRPRQGSLQRHTLLRRARTLTNAPPYRPRKGT